jgi:hypothetical protein
LKSSKNRLFWVWLPKDDEWAIFQCDDLDDPNSLWWTIGCDEPFTKEEIEKGWIIFKEVEMPSEIL